MRLQKVLYLRKDIIPGSVGYIRKIRCNVTKLLLRVGVSLNPAVYFFLAESG